MRRREFIVGIGSTAASPLVARAQTRPIPVVGYLYAGSAGPTADAAAGFASMSWLMKLPRPLSESGVSIARQLSRLLLLLCLATGMYAPPALSQSAKLAGPSVFESRIDAAALALRE